MYLKKKINQIAFLHTEVDICAKSLVERFFFFFP